MHILKSSSFLSNILLLSVAIIASYACATTTHAAFNDVTLGTPTILDVGEYTLTIYGSNATLSSLTINDSSVSVSLEGGSSIEIASGARADLAHNAAASFVINTVCSDTESRLSLSSTGETSVVTITPSGTCTASGGGSSSSGTRTSVPIATQTSDTPSVPPPSPSAHETLIEQLRTLVAQLVLLGVQPPQEIAALLDEAKAPYVRDLDLESEGNDVAELQRFLISQNTGPRSQGLAQVGATGFFGPLTQAALAEFQTHVGITPAQGYFGPKTRAYIQSL